MSPERSVTHHTGTHILGPGVIGLDSGSGRGSDQAHADHDMAAHLSPSGRIAPPATRSSFSLRASRDQPGAAGERHVSSTVWVHRPAAAPVLNPAGAAVLARIIQRLRTSACQDGEERMSRGGSG